MNDGHLEIHNVNYADNGMVKCLAVNNVKQIQWHANIKVSGKLNMRCHETYNIYHVIPCM